MGIVKKLLTYGALFYIAYSMGRCNARADCINTMKEYSGPAAYSSSACQTAMLDDAIAENPQIQGIEAKLSDYELH